jgi:hypothetical protein
VLQDTPRGSTPLLNTLMSTLRQYLQARPLGSLPLLARMLADASEKIYSQECKQASKQAATQVGGHVTADCSWTQAALSYSVPDMHPGRSTDTNQAPSFSPAHPSPHACAQP